MPELEKGMRELEVLGKIRERPGMYLGGESITRLDSFLYGYFCAYFEMGVKERGEWLMRFQKFVDEYYSNKKTIGWCDLILAHEGDEAYAFRKFYELLDKCFPSSKV